MVNFEIVAIFQDEETAQKVETELKGLFENIRDARQEVGYRKRIKTTPTWAEGMISMKYRVEWNESLEWVDENYKQIRRFMNYVFVDPNSKTRQYPNSVAALLEKMGAQVHVVGSMEGWSTRRA